MLTDTKTVTVHREIHGFEVGWSYEGHPTPQQKAAAIQEMLDRHGVDRDLWEIIPEIRYMHADAAAEQTFERIILAPQNCYWAIYGVLHEKPTEGHVPEGTRLPKYADRSYSS